MREIPVSLVTEAVRDLCIEANQFLPESLSALLAANAEKETDPLGREVLCDLCRNLDAAKELDVPICQDTGMAVVFLEIGQDVHFVGGDLNEAVNKGVSRGYLEGYLRCSVVSDPVRRDHNTGDNTPAVLHLSIVPGDKVKVTVAPKGFGSENMSAVRMLNPSATPEKIIDEVTDVIRKAGGNPCPPIVVGVGIGGDFELAAYLAKKALCRDVSERNPDPFYADMEAKMLQSVNALGIGPQGFGGDVTALAVNIETYPTHIAGLPMAVNVGCHVTRHKSRVI
ncbi:MAG: fumarate hydratase [Oscillospiraceae bacterium]|nr:fumarate hydratase [Oscillospiraceae bacterium]